MVTISRFFSTKGGFLCQLSHVQWLESNLISCGLPTISGHWEHRFLLNTLQKQLLENTEGAIQIDNPEKKWQHMVHKAKKNKAKTHSICVGQLYTHTVTNNLNKT